VSLQVVILAVLKASIVLSVIALGLRENFSHAIFLFRRPAELGRAFFSMNVVAPVLAVILALKFHLYPAVKIALVTLSVSPVPPIPPRGAIKAGGKNDYAIGLMVAAAVMSIVAIPVALEVFKRIFELRLHIPLGFVLRLVFVTVLGPLLLGMAVRARAPAFAERIAKPVNKLAYGLLILSLLPVLFRSARTIWSLIGNGTLLSLAGFALGCYVIGFFLEAPRPENRRVLALATASRHPAIAVVIANANFPQQKSVLASILLYMMVSGIVTSVALKRMRAGGTPEVPQKRMAA
jgi:bile acid:Na+ symporter, BASS family